ncbi:MAG: FtsX-like permease family protein, partial [Bacilli bacterium]
VAIARALANNPEIILADEPTGALDYQTGLQVMELLKNISQDCIVIMVTHSSELAARFADIIVEMKDGIIVNVSENKSDALVEKEPLIKEKAETKAKMTLSKALMLAKRNLGIKKARTFFTAFGMSIGILGIALAYALTGGTQEIVAGQVETIFPANMIGAAIREIDEETNKPIASNEKISYDDYLAVVEELKQTGETKDTILIFPANIMVGQYSMNLDALKNPDNYKDSSNPQDKAKQLQGTLSVVEGADLNYMYGSKPTKSNDLVLPRSIAKELVLEQEEMEQLVGQEIYIALRNMENNEVYYVLFNISGIVIENTLFSTLFVDQSFPFHIVDDYMKVERNTISYTNFFAFAKDTNKTKDTVTKLNQASSKYFYVLPSLTILNMVNSVLNVVRTALIAFSSVSVFVAILMIGIVIYISVLERKREIGIIRAIGGRAKDIRNIFVFESMLIGLFAGVLGIAGAYFWVNIINISINALLSSSDDSVAFLKVASLDYNVALALIAICGVLSVISGLIPSLGAAKLDPIKAIKSK